MSPVRGKKAKSSSKAKKTSARPARSKAKPRKVPAAKAAKPKATPKGKASPKAKATTKGKAAGTERRHCAATDPFGDPCQSAPRMQSTYCTIHSYLDR